VKHSLPPFTRTRMQVMYIVLIISWLECFHTQLAHWSVSLCATGAFYFLFEHARSATSDLGTSVTLLQFLL
jgi:hypothetical protein